MKLIDVMTKEPIKHPRRQVAAWVGPFFDCFLGEYASPVAAVKVALEGGYPYVLVCYNNGERDTIEVLHQEGL